MNNTSRWSLTKADQEKLIDTLIANLPLLRAKLDVSQEEIANIIGISRQTYSTIECKKRTMSWQIYLSLILFFDLNEETHDLLHHLDCFPKFLMRERPIQNQRENDNKSDIIQMLEKLDDRAIQSVKTVLMVEYARCSQIPGEAVVKAFDGSVFSKSLTSEDKKVAKAIDKIKQSSDTNGK